MTETILKMQKKVKRYLDKDRYDHTIGVMHTAGCLAMRYGANLEQALTAGLLHDCAKCVPADEKIKLCEKNHIEISDAEYKNPGLLHAKLGAFFAREKYGIENEEILRSIESHTTGRPNMSLLDKIIYIADYIEPGRCCTKSSGSTCACICRYRCMSLPYSGRYTCISCRKRCNVRSCDRRDIFIL